MFKKRIFLGIIFAIFFILVLLSFSFSYSAKAEIIEETKQASLISPQTKIEYSIISSPKFISYCDNKIYLNDDNFISIFDITKDEVKNIDTSSFGNPLITKHFNSSLITLIGEKIYLNNQPTTTTARNFDILGENIVIISGDKLFIYNNDLSKYTCFNNLPIGTNLSLCADSTNIFFSMKDTKSICIINSFTIDFNNSSIENYSFTNFLNFIPKTMISNGTYLYYVEGNNTIKRKNISTGTTDELSVKFTDNLGSLGNITSLCFKENNLLVASTFDDENSAIMEFSINNTTLEYTGFSISKGNTAYNRISNNALDISKNGNNIAVIDSKKITVIKNVKSEKTFVNYLISDLQIVPTKIILKQNTLIAYNDDSCITIDINTGEISNPKNIADYGLSSEWKDGTKTQYDIAKNKYTLEEGKIKVNGTSYSLTLPAGLSVDNNNIKSFAMDFESKEIYFILKDEEVILSSVAFDNKTISEMDLSTYSNTNKNADSIENLKVFTTKENCELYKVSIDFENNNKMTYLDFIDKNNYELVLIFSFTNEYNDFYLLSGFDENNREMFVLANKNDIKEVIKTKEDSIGTAYVTTPVDIYYLPIINNNRYFSLKENEDFIRLKKETEIQTEKEVTVNNKVFYYCQANINGKTYLGYVPKDFTVRTLAKQYISQTFSYKKVNETNLCNENGDFILTISNDSIIKLFNIENDKCYISFTDENGEHFGYVNAIDIVEEKDYTLKIIACVLILLTCVFVTTIYFVFIKKYPLGKMKD